MTSVLQPAVTTAAPQPLASPSARERLFGLEVDALTADGVVAAVRRLVRSGGQHHYLNVNAAKIVQIDRNPWMRSVVDRASLVVADGMAVVWAARLLGRPLPARVAGIDMMDRLLATAVDEGWRVYLLGARPDVVAEAARVESIRHPGLVVAGARDGYWTSDEEAGVVAEIRSARPHLLFVALPSPMKERFVEEHLAELGVPVVMGVGGSFDVVAGLTRRAPRWMQQAGLEWLFRLAQEPRRMFKRYLYGNAAFVRLTVRELRRRHHR